jgi:hypothetical protein
MLTSLAALVTASVGASLIFPMPTSPVEWEEGAEAGGGLARA